MSRPVRRRALPVLLVAAAVAGGVAVMAVRGGQAAPAAPAPPALATAIVARTDLVTTALTAGTLGYAATRPVVNMTGGIYTWLPRPGATIRAGGVLYRVDNTPVTLMAGNTPAWRPFTLGMTGGPDVRQLQANLIARHFAGGLLTAPTGQYDLATADALLALAGGGYGLEVVTASGARHLVGVTTGLFAAGQVQVSGPGITPGTRVVVAQ